MKTLKELAAEYDLYQEQDIPANYRKDQDYYKHRISLGANNTIPEFLQTSGDIEIGLFYQCTSDTHYQTKLPTYGIQDSFILLKSKDNDILLMLRGNDFHNRGKYWFSPFYNTLWKYNEIDNNKRSIATDLVDSHYLPNKIGVFTDKKVSDWINYCDETIAALNRLLNDVTGENTAIEKEIQAIKASLPHATVNDMHKDILWLDTELFSIKLEHHRKSAYLEKKVHFKGDVDVAIRLEKQLQGGTHT